MNWWRRLMGKPTPAPARAPEVSAPERPAPPPSAAPAPELALLHALVRGEAPPLERCLAAVASARSTPRERAAIDAVLAAHAAGLSPEPLVVAVADLLVQRGDPAAALAALEGARSTEALMLGADLHAEAGEVARAVTLVERVLARDIDAPGARERHTRWRGWLGGQALVPRPLDEATVLRVDVPETSLRIVGEAGRGGAGTVYEAIDDVLGRRVALKVYHRPEQEQDKLEREARLAVELAGRGVVRVFDVDTARGWIVMEWLPAGALKRWLTRRDAEFLLPIERWFPPLVDVLVRAHERGLVHADIKPANVLFRGPEEPVLSDFGLAHRGGERVSGGSRGYLSPERLAGEALSPADDVYALGRVLEDALEALASGAPDAEALAPWRRLVQAALAPADRRPKDAAELAALGRQLGA